MKRRYLNIMLFVCILAVLFSTQAFASESAFNPFYDVEDSYAYYYDPVLWAYKNEITTGTDSTHFSPDKTCTRAEVVTFLWRMAGKPEPETTENPFKDIEEDDWFYKSVLWAAENNVTSGTGDGEFSPNRTVTRSEFVTFLWRLDGKAEPESKSPFKDITDPDAFYYDAVLWANEMYITTGTGNGNFSPSAPCSRGQTVTFLHRYELAFPIVVHNDSVLAEISTLENIDGVFYSVLSYYTPTTFEGRYVERLKIGDTFMFGDTPVTIETIYQENSISDIIINNAYCFEQQHEYGSYEQPYYYLYSNDGYIMSYAGYSFLPWRDGAYVEVEDQLHPVTLQWYYETYFPTGLLNDVGIQSTQIYGAKKATSVPLVRAYD